MSENLREFHDILGGCERLLRAPIPVSYTRLTDRFLFIYLTLLPFALYGTVGVWTIPAVTGIAMVLCGIEEIGIQIEEPFGWVMCPSSSQSLCDAVPARTSWPQP